MDDVLNSFKQQARKKRRLSQQQIVASENLPIYSELKIYIADISSIAENDLPKDAFAYWDAKKSILPLLFNLATIILSTPAISAPCERIFSQASIVLDKRRHNLSDQQMEMEVFLKLNADLAFD